MKSRFCAGIGILGAATEEPLKGQGSNCREIASGLMKSK